MKYLSHNSTLLYILFFLVNLQIVRNLSSVYSFLLVAFYALTFLVYSISKRDGGSTNLHILVSAFFLLNVWLIFYSFINLHLMEVIGATLRVFFVIPLYFFSKQFINREDRLVSLIQIYVVIVAAGSISLIYQYIYGSLTWFVDASTRGSLDRFGSLLGSLPTYGVAGGFAICLLPITKFKYLVKIILFYLLVLGMFLTLQKAAVINLFISLIMAAYIIFSCKEKIDRKKIIIFVLLNIIAIPVVFSLFEGYINTALSFFNFSINNDNPIVSDSYGFIEDFKLRIFGELVGSENFTLSNLIFGLGFYGIGGAAGIERGIMSHNGFLDMLFMGGVVYFCTFVLVVCLIIKKLLYINDISRALKTAILFFYVLFFINFPLYTGALINPALCSIFWVFTGFLARKTRAV